jgi:uncharacterized DUF497 family protein
MNFEWDKKKSFSNKNKHGIDFDTAIQLWNDNYRIEIQTSYPLENRNILIAKLNERYWTAIFTRRANAIRIISARRSRKREVNLYEQK